MPEVVALGEAMLRLTPPNYRRLEQADCFEVEVGGAELNTAVGLVRLGRAVAWVSRLPDQPLGRLVLNRARAAGVDVSAVQLTPGGRVGLYFLEQGAAPRPGSIIYDRHDSAMAQLRPGQFDWPSLFAGARWFHVTGITPALSPTAAEAVREALHAARSAGLTVSMDVNYRAKLWSLEQARRWLQEAMPLRRCPDHWRGRRAIAGGRARPVRADCPPTLRAVRPAGGGDDAAGSTASLAQSPQRAGVCRRRRPRIHHRQLRD
jgi:2-dehydro-3-deoxygluconokinase